MKLNDLIIMHDANFPFFAVFCDEAEKKFVCDVTGLVDSNAASVTFENGVKNVSLNAEGFSPYILPNWLRGQLEENRENILGKARLALADLFNVGFLK